VSKSMNTKSVTIYSGVPLGQSLSASPPASLQLDKADRTQIEDKVRQTLDGWTEEEKATAYLYLYALGMNLDKAKTIRRKAGFVS